MNEVRVTNFIRFKMKRNYRLEKYFIYKIMQNYYYKMHFMEKKAHKDKEKKNCEKKF